MQAEQLVKDSSNNNWCICKMSYKEVKQKQYLYKKTQARVQHDKSLILLNVNIQQHQSVSHIKITTYFHK